MEKHVKRTETVPSFENNTGHNTGHQQTKCGSRFIIKDKITFDYQYDTVYSDLYSNRNDVATYIRECGRGTIEIKKILVGLT